MYRCYPIANFQSVGNICVRIDWLKIDVSESMQIHGAQFLESLPRFDPYAMFLMQKDREAILRFLRYFFKIQ